jgi:hypothetical protein
MLTCTLLSAGVDSCTFIFPSFPSCSSYSIHCSRPRRNVASFVKVSLIRATIMVCYFFLQVLLAFKCCFLQGLYVNIYEYKLYFIFNYIFMCVLCCLCRFSILWEILAILFSLYSSVYLHSSVYNQLLNAS